jgi:hypothetical protein
MTPLRFANPSPPSGWIEDFHLQTVGHTRHTHRRPRALARGRTQLRCCLIARRWDARRDPH